VRCIAQGSLTQQHTSLLRGTVCTLYAAAGAAPRLARPVRAASAASNACALAALPLQGKRQLNLPDRAALGELQPHLSVAATT
jgi:hypothetical protein